MQAAMDEVHSPWYVEQSLLHHMLGLQVCLMLRHQEVLPLLAAYLQACRPWGVSQEPGAELYGPAAVAQEQVPLPTYLQPDGTCPQVSASSSSSCMESGPHARQAVLS